MVDEPTSRAIEAFHGELQALIDRFRAEWRLSYAAAVGCLHQCAFDLSLEWHHVEDDDDD